MRACSRTHRRLTRGYRHRAFIYSSVTISRLSSPSWQSAACPRFLTVNLRRRRPRQGRRPSLSPGTQVSSHMSTQHCNCKSQGQKRTSWDGDFVVRIAQTALAAGFLSSRIFNSTTQRQRWTVWLTILPISPWLEAMRNGLGGSGCRPLEAGVLTGHGNSWDYRRGTSRCMACSSARHGGQISKLGAEGAGKWPWHLSSGLAA